MKFRGFETNRLKNLTEIKASLSLARKYLNLPRTLKFVRNSLCET